MYQVTSKKCPRPSYTVYMHTHISCIGYYIYTLTITYILGHLVHRYISICNIIIKFVPTFFYLLGTGLVHALFIFIYQHIICLVHIYNYAPFIFYLPYSNKFD